MSLVDRLVEAHIRKALDSGALDHLPGRGEYRDRLLQRLD